MPKKPTTTQVEKLIRDNKLDELGALLKGMDPIEVRMLIGDTLGDHVFDNYDIGLEKAMKEAQKIKDLPLMQRASMNIYDELPEINVNKLYEDKIKKPIKLSLFKEAADAEGMGTSGYVDPNKLDQPTIHVNTHPDMMQQSPRGVVLHEADHVSDALNKNYIPKQDMTKTLKRGLEGAEEAFSKHNKRGFFELEALKKLTKNKLLGAVPYVGAALTANEIFDSGDVFAADPTGMLKSDNVGEGSDELPDVAARDLYNAKMKRTKKLMGDK